MGCRASDIATEIKGLLVWMIKIGLSNNQNFPKVYDSGRCTCIGFDNEERESAFIHSSMSYADAYKEIIKHRAYTCILLDGAILQISYAISDRKLIKHRLGFFSSPNLERYEDDPSSYDEDNLYTEAASKNTVPFPFRFDYDSEERANHPFTHLTLGQYKGCRIPVSAPLTPAIFIRFIVSHFYNTIWEKAKNSFPKSRLAFKETIRQEERKALHVQVNGLVDNASIGI